VVPPAADGGRAQEQEHFMSVRNLRLLHRVAVDWTADTFGLRERPSGREYNEAAAYRAARLHGRSRDDARGVNQAAAARAAQRHARVRDRSQAAARVLPARLHQHREPRVLRGWQNWIASQVQGHGSRP
jgi:hypothetical protein